MNVMRIEKAYKAWGGELTTEITSVEAAIERFVHYDKEFKGKAATLNRKNGDSTVVCVYASLEAHDADCRGNEPVYAGDRMVGITTGGAWGHSVDQSLLFAYVEPQLSPPGSTFEVAVMGERRRAEVLGEPAWDPRSERLRA